MDSLKIGIPLEGFAGFCRTAAADGAVLLKNEDDVLPLKDNERISIFGRCQIDYYRCGTGSGGRVNVEYTTNLLDGLRSKPNIKVNEDLAGIYETWIKENPFDDGGGGWAAEPWYQEEMSLSDSVVKEAKSRSDKAIVVIGRTAGEDKDNMNEEGSYLLTKAEQDMLKVVCRYFDKVILVLNVSNIMDISWIENQDYKCIKSVLITWQGGMEGGNAAADVLVGDVTPSGKLTDTIAYSIDYYPSTINYGGESRNVYQEDIYVGYRYFETFCPEKVQYEFGFGLSYTDFEINCSEASLKTLDDGEEYIEINATVTNTGTRYPGKEVVQVYFEAPQGRLGRPKRILAAFSKSRLLAPGESQTLTISFPVRQMAAYDDGGYTGNVSCYVLESGEYFFYAGNSVRNAVRIPVEGRDCLFIPELRVVERLEEALKPVEPFKRMKPGRKKEDGTYELTYEDVPTRQVSIAGRIEKNLPEAIPQTGDKGYKLRDVFDKKVSMEDFVAQLSDEDLAALVRGEGPGSIWVTPGTTSAFGGVTDSLLKFGIPIACTADGPSGLRMESGHKATLLPIGTLLAATWDTHLMEELYTMEGKELVRNGIDIVLGPGLNIRRNPLNGRNFEYFSEDPLISGSFAAAAVRGIMKGGSNATLKHFACNNQEKYRTKVNAVVSERALREIYLKSFEIAVRLGGANGVMTSYNPINGHWSASNYDLNTTILRNEWGFKGIVMTDWWAMMNDCINGGPASTRNTASMVRAQNDLYMVVSNYGAEVNSGNDNTVESLENGSLTRGELQRCAINILNFLMQTPVFRRGHIFNETAVRFEAGETVSTRPAHELEKDPKIVISGGTAVFRVSCEGEYRVFVKIMSPQSRVAQSSCNIILNGKHMTTVQTSGTEGKWVNRKLMKVYLEEGIYELRVESIKQGMEIDWIEFRKL
ncbi:MAG TPA: beta-glucosidase [Clostridiaceae bacterium]|nr:beta-glucosidase [Clostridiaceae bacterium]